MHYKK